jgi:uncharacterized protein (TIGR02172 family)
MEKGELIARGRTAEVFVWKNDQVLKLFREGWTIDSAEREARITNAVHEAGLPVPSVGGVVRVQDRFGIIFERVDGPSMLQVLRSKPWAIGKLTGLMADIHFKIHSHEMPGLPSLREDLKRTTGEQQGLPEAIKKAILARLEKLPDGNTICHLDFHPDNIIMSSRGPVVIDWDGTKRGDPLADVTATSLLIRGSLIPQFIARRWLINILRSRFSSSYLKKSLRLHPGSAGRITDWEFPLVAGRLADNIPEEREMLLAVLQKAVRS